MRVMPIHPYEREHTMTQEKSRAAHGTVKALMAEDKDFLREIVRETVQQLLEAEMSETIWQWAARRRWAQSLTFRFRQQEPPTLTAR